MRVHRIDCTPDEDAVLTRGSYARIKKVCAALDKRAREAADAQRVPVEVWARIEGEPFVWLTAEPTEPIRRKR